MIDLKISTIVFFIWLFVVFYLTYKTHKKEEKRKEEKRKEEDARNLRKLRSLIRYLMAHPDNEEDSEFADRIDDLNGLIENLNNNFK